VILRRLAGSLKRRPRGRLACHNVGRRDSGHDELHLQLGPLRTSLRTSQACLRPEDSRVCRQSSKDNWQDPRRLQNQELNL
jgi:hypothetical protein